MAPAYDSKVLLTLLCLSGIGLVAACNFGGKQAGGAQSSIRMGGG